MNPIKNKVYLIGQICDPKITVTEHNLKIADFRLYTTETFFNHEGQQRTELMTHKCLAYGQVASILERSCVRKKQIALEGFLVTTLFELRTWSIPFNHVQVTELLFLT